MLLSNFFPCHTKKMFPTPALNGFSSSSWDNKCLKPLSSTALCALLSFKHGWVLVWDFLSTRCFFEGKKKDINLFFFLSFLCKKGLGQGCEFLWTLIKLKSLCIFASLFHSMPPRKGHGQMWNYLNQLSVSICVFTCVVKCSYLLFVQPS